MRRNIRFGLFELNVATGELLKNRRRIPVEPQPLLILALLLEHPGEVVARDQLRSALWADGTFVDFDRGLNVAVKKLRHALGDSSDNPRFIETLSRRGYRFIAPVHPAEPDAGTVSEAQATPRRMQAWARTGAVVATVVAAFMFWRGASSRPTDRNPCEINPVPPTAYGGFEGSPSLSADGNQVAFSWDGERQDNADIYIKLLDTASPVRLTWDRGTDNMPAWSPDGRNIAFVRTRILSGTGQQNDLLRKINLGYTATKRALISAVHERLAGGARPYRRSLRCRGRRWRRPSLTRGTCPQSPRRAACPRSGPVPTNAVAKSCLAYSPARELSSRSRLCTSRTMSTSDMTMSPASIISSKTAIAPVGFSAESTIRPPRGTSSSIASTHHRRRARHRAFISIGGGANNGGRRQCRAHWNRRQPARAR